MSTIVLIIVDLEIVEPWCVGAPEQATSPGHLPTVTDPFGEIVIPASSIAGSLRDHLRRGSGDDSADGAEVEIMGGDVDGALTPSPLRVLGVEVNLPADRGVVIRTQTAMDPTRGAAAVNTLRSSDLAPAGTAVRVELRVDGDPHWLDGLLAQLASWAPFIGRARTSGMGAARVTRIRSGRLDLSDPDALARWLSMGGPALTEAVATTDHPVAKTRDDEVLLPLGRPLVWRARDAVLIGGEVERSARRPYRRDGRLLIEGSALKGVLRSRVGYVVRSLGLDGCVELTGCGRARCPVCTLFGSTTQRGAVRVQTAELHSTREVTRHHVAIDRFTGGARPGLLFSDEDVPIGATFEMRVSWSDGSAPDWVAPLLAAAMLDLHDGYVGIGAKTTSGYGTIALDEEAATELRALLSDSAWIDEIAALRDGDEEVGHVD